jgi:hypothetical protein
MALDTKISGFINKVLDQVIDHARTKLESVIRDLDAQYGLSAKIKQVIDFIKRIADDIEKTN